MKTIASKATLAGLALIAATLVSVPQPVSATRGQSRETHKVTICHATNAHSKPYVVNTVDKSSVDEPNNKYLNGHGDHTGPVWFDGIADHSWGDIIPPFTNDAGHSYPGQNWNASGKAIWKNECKVANSPQSVLPATTAEPGKGGKVLGYSQSSSPTSPVSEGKVLADTGVSSVLTTAAAIIVMAAVGATNYLFRRKAA